MARLPDQTSILPWRQAAIETHISVLLPERFSGTFPPCTFGTRCRASPEPHPFLVLTQNRAPESFTPSAGSRHSPKNFPCRFSIVVLPYHNMSGMSIAYFDKLSAVQGRIFPLYGQKVPCCPQLPPHDAAFHSRRPSIWAKKPPAVRGRLFTCAVPISGGLTAPPPKRLPVWRRSHSPAPPPCTACSAAG